MSTELGRTHSPWTRSISQRLCGVSANYAEVQSVGGVLSLDVSGPLVPAKDIGGLRARWMLVGTLTWAVPAESDKLKDPPKSSGGLSERSLHTAEAIPRGIAQPTPVRGRSLEDAAAKDVECDARDGSGCLPTSLLADACFGVTTSGDS